MDAIRAKTVVGQSVIKEELMKDNIRMRAKTILSLFDVVTFIFIALRACDVVDWKWWQVLMPFFIGIVAAIIVGIRLGFLEGSDEE